MTLATWESLPKSLILDNPEVSAGNGPTLSSVTICGLGTPSHGTRSFGDVLDWTISLLEKRMSYHLPLAYKSRLAFWPLCWRIALNVADSHFSTHIDATCQLVIEVNDSRLRSRAGEKYWEGCCCWEGALYVSRFHLLQETAVFDRGWGKSQLLTLW